MRELTIKEKLNRIDYFVLLPTLFLAVVGLIMVYSASSYLAAEMGNSEYFLWRQLSYNVIGIILMLLAFFMNIKLLHQLPLIKWATLITGTLLLLVLFLGQEVNGAKAWLNLGFFNIQPAEIAKLTTIWLLAYYFYIQRQQINRHFWKTLRPVLLYLLVVNLLLLMQPDMGSIIIINGIAFVMILGSGVSWWWSFKMTLLVAGLVILGFILIRNFGELLTFIPSYQMDRFRAFFDPFGYSDTAGHQLVNSYYALSRGGLTGVGIGNSVQKSGYLPEPHTDFIMAITAEELGLLFTLLIIFVYFILVLRLFVLAARAKSSFNSNFCLGAASYFFIQGTINLGGVSGLLPITGVTFPFVSFGGSSILISYVLIGLVLNIYRNEKRGGRTNGRKNQT